MFELLFEVLGELVFNLVLELLARGASGLWSVFSEAFRRKTPQTWQQRKLAEREAFAKQQSHLRAAILGPGEQPQSPWITGLTYAAFGVAVGYASVWIWGQHLTAPGFLRFANLLVSPLVAGTLMALLGAWRAKRGLAVLPLDRFVVGWLFAQCMVGTRFVLLG